MRNIFIKNLIDEARKDKNFYTLTADLGYRAFDPFRDKFPDRFINVGVAEANMIGLAAGLALSGKKVCVYSIAPFITLRCLEQIRNDICCHKLNVNLIGVGGGFSYGPQGISHNTIEDLAIMKILPNMTVLCPGDKIEADLVTKAALSHPGPTYLRLGKAGEKEVYHSIPEFAIGKGILVKKGFDITLFSIGNIIEVVLLVARELEKKDISSSIISMPCLKPIDWEIIIKAAKETKAIFTIEEHSLIGGLGSAVAEVVLESDYSNIIFKRIGLPDKLPEGIGSQNYLRNINGLSVQEIIDKILKELKFK